MIEPDPWKKHTGFVVVVCECVCVFSVSCEQILHLPLDTTRKQMSNFNPLNYYYYFFFDSFLSDFDIFPHNLFPIHLAECFFPPRVGVAPKR